MLILLLILLQRSVSLAQAHGGAESVGGAPISQSSRDKRRPRRRGLFALEANFIGECCLPPRT